MRCLLIVGFLLATPLFAVSTDPPSAEEQYDLDFLKQQGIKGDLPSLLAYLQDRTLDDVKIKRIRELIVETGHARFAVRDRAAKDLLKFGVSALKFLEEASKDKDPEIADRARRVVETIKQGPGPSLSMTVLRRVGQALGNGTSSDAVLVILRFLPFADDAAVEDDAIQTLTKIGISDGKPDSHFKDFVQDSFTARRAAGGYVLGRSKNAVDVALARKLLLDADAWVRLRTIQGLLAGEQRDAIPQLIKLIDPEIEEITWRAEELLRRIAGEDSPSAPADAKPESRKTYLAAWNDWWDKKGKAVDLAKLSKEQPLLGLWLGIEYNTNSVWECGRDGKRRWTISAEGPMDAQVLPGNRVLIAEQSAKRVTERDLKGNMLWEYVTNEDTINCQRLPNGNTWIGTRNNVMEIRPNKSIVYKHQLSGQYMHGVRRLTNGNSIGITSGGVIYEMNPAGKLLRTITVPHEGTWGDVDALPNGNLLVANYGTGFVREVDQTGKTVREVKTGAATGVERQPNGQLLVGGGENTRLIDWTGRELWSAKSNGSVRRIHLR